MTGARAPKAVWATHALAAHLVGRLAERVGPTALLCVKGVVTGRTLYADVSERPLGDLDLRVVPEQLGAVVAAGRACGLDVVHTSRAYGSALLRGHGLDVDVESCIGAPGLTGLRIATLLERSASGAPLGLAARIPSPADHALVLAANLFKDKVGLGAPWGLDDALRLASGPDFDPDLVAARAVAARMGALVLVVSRALAARSDDGRRAPGSLAWGEVAERLERRVRRRAYVRACELLFRRSPTSLGARLLARCAADDVGLRLAALGGALAFSVELRRQRGTLP